MEQQDFFSELPNWAENFENQFRMKFPFKVYRQEVDPKTSPSYMFLSCADNCGARVELYYHGLTTFFPDYEKDKFLEFNLQDKNGGSSMIKNIEIDLTNEKLVESFITFIKDSQKLASCKIELSKSICHKIIFSYKRLEIKMMVKKDGSVLLCGLSSELGKKVYLLSKPESYKEMMGVIHRFDKEIDMVKTGDKIPEHHQFYVLVNWVKNLVLLHGFHFNKEDLLVDIIKY